jgi:hypothetical protein
MAVIDGVESHEGREQADVGLGQDVAAQVAGLRQPFFTPIEISPRLSCR